MRTILITSVAVFLLWVVPTSCTKYQLEQERRPELYASAYDFEYRVSANNYRYLVPVAHNRISEETLRKKVSGQGWKTTAVYQINQDKEVIKEYVLVTGGTISSARNETSPDYLIFSDDSQSVSFYVFWDDLDKPGAYETDPFTYDATDNAITLPIWFGSWGGNGRLVFLSSDTMVCVCTHDKDYAGTELIFMEILQRVSKKERQSWIDRCPNYGLLVYSATCSFPSPASPYPGYPPPKHRVGATSVGNPRPCGTTEARAAGYTSSLSGWYDAIDSLRN